MQNTSTGSKSTSKSLHNVSESMRDPSAMRESAEQIVTDLGQKASRFADETAETAEEYYNRASSWVQQNYGKTLGIFGFLAAVGTIGYLLGRNNARSEIQNPMSRRS